jgi:hypothetical protein
MHFSRPAARSLLLATSLALAAALASCTTTTASLQQQIYTADKTVDAIVVSADAAWKANLITVAQAQSVSTIAHQVNPLLDAAKAANEAGNSASASSTMTLVTKLLAGLQAYVPTTPTQ